MLSLQVELPFVEQIFRIDSVVLACNVECGGGGRISNLHRKCIATKHSDFDQMAHKREGAEKETKNENKVLHEVHVCWIVATTAKLK